MSRSGAPSAKGLFRATGKRYKPVIVNKGRDLAGAFEVAESLAREPDDFYPTPPEPIRALISVECNSLSLFSSIWEPAAGDGALVREMETCGFTVISSDLIDRGCGAQIKSFYDFRAPLSFAIVTNPPFAECNEDPGWIRHALETLAVEYMALLLPVNWMGSGDRRAKLWADFPPARIYLMRWRIDFTGQGAPPMLNAWYIWDRTWCGETVLRMLDRKDARQHELFGGDAA